MIDTSIDARNPRTANRELPSGQLTEPQVALFCLVSLGVFLLAVWQLDPIVRWLWPIPVAGFVIYPYLKRFTYGSHLWLGAVDGLAPVGAWIAITGNLPLEAWLLGAAVACWVAGFDCFYALLDVDFDRREGLKSVATAFGERGAIWAARVLHVATVGLLIAVGVLLDVGFFYWVGVIAVAVLLIYEHALVRPGDLRRLDAAFFLVNGIISVTFFVFVLLDSVF
jgi:4-hydroxybenzoate polyprenyltransferase